jgi:hypothetical protein
LTLLLLPLVFAMRVMTSSASRCIFGITPTIARKKVAAVRQRINTTRVAPQII